MQADAGDGAAAGNAAPDAPPDTNDDEASQLDDVTEVLQDARRRLAEVPAEVVVTNHVMGLYELAAIHLSSSPPDLRSAALAIDSVASLVEGLGDRLGSEAATMRDALANIRLAFVQIKSSVAAAAAPTPSPPDGTAPDGLDADGG